MWKYGVGTSIVCLRKHIKTNEKSFWLRLAKNVSNGQCDERGAPVLLVREQKG